ncbi:MAG: ABC transporter substrate-binding protein [Gemmatimonadetes bacterium]|nr:ABC transporter substrate-binding protein [Gemmatimonadota bacterium]
MRRHVPIGRRLLSLALLSALVTAGCVDDGRTSVTDPASLRWDEVVESARGTRVVWRMWRGDPSINAYVDGWVAPRLLELYGIELRAVEGQGPELVNQLVVERSARAAGSADLVWINGETFHNLRGEDLLYGPWAGRLPNAALIDSASAIIMLDFEQDPAGFESPWGRVQFALIYDTTRTPEPPRTVRELGEWIRANPGRFTHDQSFTGTAFHKVVMYALAGGVEQFQGGFDEIRYQAGAERLWSWLGEHRTAFWREGTVYPAGAAELHRMFSNREVDFSMSYNENEVVSKVRQGILPRTARALVLRDGTIANAHYLGIPFNSPNPAGAMVVADFLLSPEAQFEKLKPEVWADGTVLDPARMPAEWRFRFDALGRDPRSIPLDTLRRYAVPEVAPGYHERLSQEWRERIRAAPR